MDKRTNGLAGGKPKAGKILVGGNNSWGVLRAASLVGEIFSRIDPTITLSHK